MVEVIECSFALKSQFVVLIQAIKSEHGLRTSEGSRKPTSMKKLNPGWNENIRSAVTEVDKDRVKPGGIDHTKSYRPSRWAWARCPTMTELDMKTKRLEGDLFEKGAVPLLGKVWELEVGSE